jgi:hypothetical protein
MTYLADYKLKLFADAAQVHFDQEPISDFAEDDLAALPEATQFQLEPASSSCRN